MADDHGVVRGVGPVAGGLGFPFPGCSDDRSIHPVVGGSGHDPVSRAVWAVCSVGLHSGPFADHCTCGQSRPTLSSSGSCGLFLPAVCADSKLMPLVLDLGEMETASSHHHGSHGCHGCYGGPDGYGGEGVVVCLFQPVICRF